MGINRALEAVRRDPAAAILDAAATSLFPLLALSAICNQVRPFPWLMTLGHVASLGLVFTAIAVVTLTFRARWTLVLVALVLLTRAWRVVSGDADNGAAFTAYTGAAFLLFGLAGSVMLERYTSLLQRQVVWLCALSLPFMVLQVIGVEWVQALRTDRHNEYAALTSTPTLFVPIESLKITTLQSRPAGLFSSNNYFSLFLVFIAALRFGRASVSARPSVEDLIVLAVIVLAMAKLTFLVMAGLLVVMWWNGERARMAGLVVAAAAMLVAYGILFPGLFVHNLAPYNALMNISVRTADLLIGTGQARLVDLGHTILRVADYRDPNALIGGKESGYAQAVANAPVLWRGLLIPVLGIAAILALRPGIAGGVERRLVASVAGAAVLSPLITPFFGVPVFGFFAGAAIFTGGALWGRR